MKAKELPSLNYLNECFELSEDSPTGLIWKRRPSYHFPKSDGENWNRRFPGQKAGAVLKTSSHSYYAVRITTGAFKVHRVVYCLSHKVEMSSDTVIDHIDGNGLNNKISNLRIASECENAQNRKTSATNLSGFRGVSWFPSRGVWRYRVCHNGVNYCRYAPTAEEANKLACELREELHAEFCNHGV